eukprot:s1525_g7.t1
MSVAHIFCTLALAVLELLGLRHLPVVRYGLLAAFNEKNEGVLKLACWDAAGCLGDRATEHKPWFGSRNGSNPTENKEQRCACDFWCGSGHKAKIQRCAVTQWPTRWLFLAISLIGLNPMVAFYMRWARTKCQVLAETGLQVIGLCFAFVGPVSNEQL